MTQHISIEDLSAHLDDALPPARRDLVDAHLASCADCRAEQASLAWADAFARSLPPAEMPDGLSFAIPVPEAPVPQATSATRRPRLGWMLIGAVAALLLVAVGLGRLLSEPVFEGTAQLSSGPAGEAADVGGTSGGAASQEDQAAAPGSPLGAPTAGSAAGTVTAVIAAGQSLDIDTASRVAGGLVKEGDQAETRTGPLATALAADRERRVTGQGAAASPAPGGAIPAAAGTAGAGTATPAIDRGGYAPPDAPIPGLPGGRTDRDGAASATATRPGSGAAAASAAGTAGTQGSGTPLSPGTGTVESPATGTAVVAQVATRPLSTPESAGGGVSVPAGTHTAWAATNTVAREQSARSGTATALAGGATAVSTRPPESAAYPVATSAPPATDSTPAAGTAATAEPPGDAAPLSRTLLVPLSALSIGLLAIGILLLRQARARRRRRGWREG
jgi:hypothetical protein